MSLQQLPGTASEIKLPLPLCVGFSWQTVKLPGTNHYQIRLLQSASLLLKNHSLFLQNRYALQQAAILRGTFSSILSGEGFDEVERGELPFVFWAMPLAGFIFGFARLRSPAG
jgi:hypothetical protein